MSVLMYRAGHPLLSFQPPVG